MKTFTRIMMTTVALLFFLIQGFSQTATVSEQKTSVAASTTQGKFLDSNNNGVCDNFEMRSASGRGAGFVDKDGDGVCDNRSVSAGAAGNREFCGKGYQHRHGCGQGKGNCCGRGPCKGKQGAAGSGINSPGNKTIAPAR